MGCSTCSPSASSVSPTAVGCGTALGPMPRRVSSPPISPYLLRGIAMARQAFSGRLLMGGCDDEVFVLDGSISGPVLYDANTGKVSVGEDSGTGMVKDLYPCDTPAGLFLMGKDPGCRQPGENPDREVVVVRPQNSDTGILFGFNQSCPPGVGLSPEMTPVKIAPGALPATHPAVVESYAVTPVPPEECLPATNRWYKFRGLLPIPDDLMETFVFPNRPLTVDDNETFGLGILVKTVNGWIFKRATNESFQTYIDTVTVNPVVYLSPRANIYNQLVPSPGVIAPDVKNVDLTLLPGYSAKAKEIQLHIFTVLLRNFGGFSIIIEFNGVSKYIATTSTNSGSQDNGEVTVPIPADKQLVINVIKIVDIAGISYPGTGSSVDIFLESFR